MGYRPGGRRVRDKAFAVVVAVGLAAALLLPAAPVAGAPATPLPVPPIAWSNCPTNPGFLCASVAVPIDYRAPTRGSLSIAVIERPASTPHPAGQLLFNPGGPGESGVQVLPVFASLAPPSVLNQFDLVSFDERGTGASSKLNCGPTPPVATSAPPTPAGPAAPLPAAAVFASMAASCRANYPTLFAHVDSIDAARDMDRIRSALGASTISYWGISYGTVLGAQYARLFPARVRSMVLDGAVVPTEALTLQAQQEAPPMATNLQHFFATCAADPACPLNPNPPGPYLAVETKLASNPLPSPADGVPVTDGDLDTAALFYLTVPRFAGDFAHAVAAAGAGDGAPLRSMAVSFSTDIDGSSVLGPLWTYTCNDAADRPGGVAAGRLARALTRSNPPIGGFAVTYLLAGCVHWPASSQAIPAITYGGRAPILVIGNSEDPNTPHVAAVVLARALHNARLVTWRGFGHTWLLNGNDDPCTSRLVTGYLLNGVPPPNNSVC